MKNGSAVTRGILLAYGYTTETLAIDLDVPEKTARQILHGKSALRSSNLGLLGRSIIGVDMNFLMSVV